MGDFLSVCQTFSSSVGPNAMDIGKIWGLVILKQRFGEWLLLPGLMLYYMKSSSPYSEAESMGLESLTFILTSQTPAPLP